MGKKDGMYLYNDWIAPFEKLERADLGELILAMMKYNAKGEKPPRFEGMLGMAADYIFPQMDRSMEYARLGSLGGSVTMSKKKSKGDAKKNTGADEKEVEEKKEDQEDFERIWKIYPKKIGRQDAYKVFKEISVDSKLLEKIISAICEQKKSYQWTKEDGRYIPNLANWLEGRRWEDEAIFLENDPKIKENKYNGSFDTDGFFEDAVRRAQEELFEKYGISGPSVETILGT